MCEIQPFQGAIGKCFPENVTNTSVKCKGGSLSFSLFNLKYLSQKSVCVFVCVSVKVVLLR